MLTEIIRGSAGQLTINLDAIVKNWYLLRKRIKSYSGSAECGAVVKANAYGLGAQEVASALCEAGCKLFFVSTLAEAIELRTTSVADADIVVLTGLAHGMGREWEEHRITPVLFEATHIDSWRLYCENLNQRLASVLKVDSGMHRLGLSSKELLSLLNDRERLQGCNPYLLMSHLACSDEPSHQLNDQQLSLFKSMAKRSREVSPQMKFSLMNSSGFFLGKQFSFDVGRPGAALYGINPTPGAKNPMNTVVTLQLPIMQVKTVAQGDSVGYGADFVASRTTRLAVVYGGYADGLLRALSCSGFAFYNGSQVPLVGRVSMDSMIFDITEVQDCSVPHIELIGENQSLDDLAAMAGTIGYELLTGLGKRYHRRYIKHKKGFVDSE